MSVKFHIPGLARSFNLNMVLLMLMHEFPEQFREDVSIGSFWGEFPSSVWNGGIRSTAGFSEEDVSYVISELNGRGIAVRYTFTNVLVNQSHLGDRWCNRCMKLADTPDSKNGVIVASPVLEKHLRAKYPHFRYISSDAKQITDFDALCAELEQYDSVLIDYSLNANTELLEKLPHKERAELLVNCVCPPECPRRKGHIQYLGRTQIAYAQHVSRFGLQAAFHNPESFQCPYLGKTYYQNTDNPTLLTPEKVFETLVPMGFENFRIEGRWSSPLSVLDTYLNYLAKPEYRDQLRLTYLLNLEQNGILRFEG